MSLKEKDLIELLSSTIEEDAIISRIYNLFHITCGYTIKELNAIIEFGRNEGIFKIENVSNPSQQYNDVEWNADNVEQEILVTNDSKEQLISVLFSSEPRIPNLFKQFID